MTKATDRRPETGGLPVKSHQMRALAALHRAIAAEYRVAEQSLGRSDAERAVFLRRADAEDAFAAAIEVDIESGLWGPEQPA
jgi:hypothetical protein